jgi:F0F1-type ATP synthase assembly protein I
MAAHHEESRPWTATYGGYLTLGLQLAITVVIFFFIGRWLDETWGTDPWLMLCGLAVGIAGGMISFLRTVARLGKQQDREAAKRREGAGHEA